MLDKYFPIYVFVFIITFIFTVLAERLLIPRLSAKARQPIYDEGPSWHLKKSGTPTMGGLAFLTASSVSLLLSCIFCMIFISKTTAISVLISLIFAISNAAVGIIDDIKKLKRQRNAGLSPKQKLILQLLISILFLVSRQFILNDGTEIQFSFGSIDIGFLYYPLSVFLILGVINSANLTDGIDGLASSVAFAIGVSLIYISAALNLETSLIAAAIIGSAIGFLIFNLHPAKIFMGDTGSLFFGALTVSAAFTLKNPIVIIFIAAIYILEGVSVVLQVSFYKLRHKRIFKMAPLHHHLEKCGWSENKICIVAILATLICSIPAYIFYLP